MSKMKERIGFVGCGNMGSGILAGLVTRRTVRASQVYIYDPDHSKTAKLKRKFKIQVSETYRELITRTDVIILAVKPQMLTQLAHELRPWLRDKLLISILAGTPIAKLKDLLGARLRLVRAMPNLGATISESMTIVCGKGRDVKRAQVIFASCGQVVHLSERFLDLVTAVSGSGPAYFFALMEWLTQFAIKKGLPAKRAQLLVKQTVFGTAKLIMQSKDAPVKWRRRVTSKGGTTEAAFRVLQKEKVKSSFQAAFDSAFKRAKQLSRS